MREDGGGENTEAKKPAAEHKRSRQRRHPPRLREKKDENKRHSSIHIAWLNTQPEPIRAEGITTARASSSNRHTATS